MSDESAVWAPQDALWELGTSFIEAGADEADAAIQAGVERVARMIGAGSAGLWRFDPATSEAERIAKWAASPEDEFDRSVVVPHPSLAHELARGDGLAVMPLELVIDEATVQARGWDGRVCAVSTVDERPDESVVLVLASRSPRWDQAELAVIRTFTLILRQFHRRVHAERELEYGLRLEDFLVDVAERLLTVGPHDADDVVRDALQRIHDIVDAQAIVLIDVVDDHLAELRFVTAARRLPDELNRLVIEDVSALPGAGDMTLREYVSERRVMDVATVVDGLLGTELTDRFGLREDKRSVALLPASTAGAGQAVIAAVRTARHAWQAVEFDALTTVGSLVAQTRARMEAEAEASFRLELQRTLIATGKAFLEADEATGATVVHDAIARLGAGLGADLAVVTTFAPDRGSVLVEESWSASDQFDVPVGTPIKRNGLVDELTTNSATVSVNRSTAELNPLLAESPDGKWTTVVAPIHGPATIGSALTLVFVGAAAADEPLHREMANALADLIGQFRARARAERRDEWRLARQRLLGECAADLAEAGTDDLFSVVESVLGRVCVFLELSAVSIWRSDSRRELFRRVAVATDDFEPDPCGEYAWGTASMLDDVRVSGAEVRIDEDPASDRPRRVALPRGDGTSVESIVVATGRRSGPWDDEDLELLRSLGRTIREVEARVAAERYADRAFQRAPIGVVMRDRDLNLITCNQAFVDFVGAESVDELVGTPPAHVYDDTFEDVQWTDIDGELVGEAAFRGQGGGRVWGQMRASVVHGDRDEDFWLIHVEDVTERRRAEQLLRFQASHDELTGLANRRQLLAEIHRLADGHGSAAVLLLDLDRFKIINDSLGHDRGDELLVVIADRLRLAVRPGDLVARLGGDEFAVLLPGPVSVAEATFVADRLLGLIGEPLALGRQKIYPTASIGVAVIDDDMAVDDLLRRADTAMYRAKAQGRARHAAFDEDLRDEVTNRMATEAGLRGALRDGDLLVHYQPEVSLEDGRLLGAEALVRWQHPERGLLAAGLFIDVAEETGLVVEIGEIVLRAACAEAARWPGGDLAPVVRVNLAAAQLQREDTVDLVRTVLAQTGLPPHRLCLEITESAVMSDIRRSEEILARLKALGLRLAVDDFGTGFSSLAYLKRFPVDALKIDRAFVRDLGETAEDTAFVRSIVSLADALELDVVAEGVETQAQAALLLELGCRRAQGFLFARPGPPEDLAAYLRGVAG